MRPQKKTVNHTKRTFSDIQVLDGNSNHVSVGHFSDDDTTLYVCKCFQTKMAYDQSTPWAEFIHQQKAAQHGISPHAHMFAWVRYNSKEREKTFEIIRDIKEEPSADWVEDQDEDDEDYYSTHAMFSEYLSADKWLDWDDALKALKRKLPNRFTHIENLNSYTALIRDVTIKLMVATENLHKLGILHNDMFNPHTGVAHNFLFNVDTGNVKIIDFGLSTEVSGLAEAGLEETSAGIGAWDFAFHLFRPILVNYEKGYPFCKQSQSIQDTINGCIETVEEELRRSRILEKTRHG